VGLLENILARPDDDDARLVYADHLLEKGEPRGELIAVQVKLARLESAGAVTSAEYRVLRTRERLLLKTMPLGTYRRGFVTRCELTMNEVRGTWPVREPLEEIEIVDAYSVNELTLLKEHPGCLRTVIVHEPERVIELDAATLFAITPKARWKWPPEAIKTPIEQRGVERLSDTEMPMLRRFSLMKGTNGFRTTRAALQQFVRSEAFAQIEKIELQKVYDTDVATVVPALHAPTRVAFGVNVGVLTPAILGRWLANVRTLDLSLSADDEVVAKLAAQAPKLEELKLWGVIPPRFDPLAKQLRSLDLMAGSQPIGALGETPFERLTSLTLRMFNLDAGLDFETLVDLRLVGCYFWEKEIEADFRARWPDAEWG
jgi:uncharacterized protein (TIGR02996 family)